MQPFYSAKIPYHLSTSFILSYKQPTWGNRTICVTKVINLFKWLEDQSFNF